MALSDVSFNRNQYGQGRPLPGNDYISGMDMKDIAKKYRFKYARTCYYHLGKLTDENKTQHLLNKRRRTSKN